MQIDTTRFGPLETEIHTHVRFPTGLLGFPGIHDYVFVEAPDAGPFKWLQAVTEPDLAFVVMDPYLFMEDYRIEVSAEDLRELGAHDSKHLNVLVILTITPPDVNASAIQNGLQSGHGCFYVTANLQGPIVLNQLNSLAKQLVLVRSPYHTRHVLPFGHLGPSEQEEHEASGRCA